MLRPVKHNPNRHHIVNSEPEFMSFVRRRYPQHAKTLFITKHTQNQNFAICGWTSDSKDRFVELIPLGDKCSFGPEERDQMDIVMNPPKEHNRAWDNFAQIEASQGAADDRQREEMVTEVNDTKKHLKRKTGSDHPFFSPVI